MGVTLQALQQVLLGGRDERRSEIALIDLDERTDAVKSERYKILQYFPETITDNKAVNWVPKEIPGGSLPLYQWVSSGERQISFTAKFSCDVDYGADLLKITRPTDQIPNIALGGVVTTKDLFRVAFSGVQASPPLANVRFERLKAVGEDWRNPNIAAALIWLRGFMMPRYGTSQAQTYGALGIASTSGIGTNLTFAPRKLLLVIPGTGIGLYGGVSASTDVDRVRCIMVGCDITLEALFPSGVPRYATVDLRFNQVAQFGDRVEFPAAGVDMDASGFDAYRMPSRRAI